MRRQRRTLSLLILVGLGLFLLLGGVQSSDVGQAQAQAQVPPKLSGALQRLLEYYRAGPAGAAAAQAYAQTQGVEIRGPEERLVVVVEGLGDLSPQIHAQGGVIQAKYKGFWQVELPLGNLEALAQAAAVSYIRLPQVALIPSPLVFSSPGPSAMATAAQAQGPIVSEGVFLTGADQLHARGITGRGVKVGIIDLGFAGLDQVIQEGELPAEVHCWNCRGREQEQRPLCRPVSPEELSTASKGQPHGTAVAEIVHDMAPDAELHLFLVKTKVELGQAVEKAIDKEIKVISHSVAWFNEGFYDGRGSIGSIVRTARQNGIFWVNAAGNFAQTHYEGTFQDRDGDGYHDVDIKLELEARQGVVAFLTWDAWPRTHEDFDLFLFKGPKQVAASINKQNGTEPDERIFFTASEGGAYRLRIKWVGEGSPPPDRRLELFLLVPPGVKVQPDVPESSLPAPANAQEAFAVGAIGAGKWEEGALEPFSSWGPTNDGREKPDLVGPDCVRTASYAGAATAQFCGADGLFPGTSAAAPHIAGAAALLLSEDPERTPADLERLLRERARPAQGTPNQVGAGQLYLTLPELPDLVIASAEAKPEEVQAGETVKIQAVVRNTGSGAAGPFWVVLWRAEQEGQVGQELVSRRVSQGLEPGKEQEVVLEWAVPAKEPAGEERLVVVADPYGDVREQNEENNRQELTVRIRPQARPAFFAVTGLELPTTARVNTPVEIAAEIQNTGEEAGTKDIWLEIKGREVDWKEVDRKRDVRLGPGETTTVRFSYTFTDAGHYTVKVATPDDAREGTLTVEARPAFFAVGPISVSPGTSFPEGTTATFEAEITNQGDESGTKTIDFSIDGVKEDSQSLTLGPGQSEVVRFSYTFTSAGHYTVRISSPDASQEIEVTAQLPAVLEVSPTSLQFQGQEGGSNPSAQPLTIRNTGGQPLNWKATTEADWLKLSSTSGTVAAGQSTKVQVSVNISGLSAGTYRAAIIISAPGARNSPARVDVALEITPRPAVLEVSPTSLSFSAKEGGSDPSPKELTITNTGGGLLEWQVTTNVDWIMPGVNGGSLEAGQSFELTVFAHIQGLPAGTHKGVITISAPGAEGSPVRVEVTLTISP